MVPQSPGEVGAGPLGRDLTAPPQLGPSPFSPAGLRAAAPRACLRDTQGALHVRAGQKVCVCVDAVSAP